MPLLAIKVQGVVVHMRAKISLLKCILKKYYLKILWKSKLAFFTLFFFSQSNNNVKNVNSITDTSKNNFSVFKNGCPT